MEILLWCILPFSVLLGAAAIVVNAFTLPRLHRIDQIDTGYPKGAGSEPKAEPTDEYILEHPKPKHIPRPVIIHSIDDDLNRMNKKRNRFME